MIRKRFLVSAASAACLAVGPAIAQVPELDSGIALTDPDLRDDSGGFPLGSFRLHTALKTEYGFDDNVFRNNKNPGDGGTSESGFVSLSPRLELRSNWAVHEFRAYAHSETYWFFDQPSEDHTDAVTGFDGRIDVSRIFNVRVAGFGAHLNETRDVAEFPGTQAEPTEIWEYGGSVAATVKPNRLSSTVGAEVVVRDFKDAPVNGGGIPINHDDRDHRDVSYFVELAYDVIADGSTTAFVRGTRHDRDYTNLVGGIDDNGDIRGDDGYGGEAGLRMQLTSLLKGEMAVGYRHTEYDDPAFGDTSGVTARGALTWTPDELWTVLFSASHDVRATSLDDTSSGTRQEAGVQVIWDPREHLQFVFGAQYARIDFPLAGGEDRQDHHYNLHARANYTLNRYAVLSLEYQLRNRNSDAVAEDYTANIVRVGLTLRR